jgi:ATP-dependent DNA ligase
MATGCSSLSFDGFRAAADTVRGRLVSRQRQPDAALRGVHDLLPKGHVFDGEIVLLDDAGRPLFNELLFGRRRPTYVAFDPLMASGIDLRSLPLREREAALARIGKGADRWIALTNGVVGDGRALYRAVVDADLEGIVAKRLADAYRPKYAKWHKGPQLRLLEASRPCRMVSLAPRTPCRTLAENVSTPASRTISMCCAPPERGSASSFCQN